MSSVNILHMADIHIGRKFKNLPPRKAAIRETEVLLTLEHTLQRFSDADIVLLAGDIFEEDAPRGSIDFVCNLFSKYPNKYFFMSCGNHDCRESAAIKYFISKAGENVHVFSDVAEQIVLEKYGAVVCGVSFSAPSSYTSLIDNFKCSLNDYVRIMVLHGDAETDSVYNPISSANIAQSGLNYLALGHIHSFKGIHKIGSTSYAYPGILEPGGFDETEKSGAIYGVISEENVELSCYSVAQRKYHVLEVDVSPFSSNEELISNLKRQLCSTDIYKITLVGNSEFFVDVTKCEDVLDVFSLEIVNETRNSKSIMSYTNETSFRGKTALSLAQLESTCDRDVFDMACDILTKLMCKD